MLGGLPSSVFGAGSLGTRRTCVPPRTGPETAVADAGAKQGLTGALGRAASLGMSPARRARQLLSGSTDVDWDAEGLLDGVDPAEREQRRGLLDDLHQTGASVTELRSAVEAGRLAVMPVERVLAGEEPFTSTELAERVGVDVDVLRGDLLALGFAVPAEEVKAFDEHDLEAARAIAAFRAAGIDGAQLRGVGRILGHCLNRAADATRSLIADHALEPGIGEHDIGLRIA